MRIAKRDRIKIVSIEEQLLVDIFNWWRNPPHMIALPVADELPEDCEVLRVFVNYERRCIDAIVYSSQFPVCPPECVPERVSGVVCEFRTIPFPEKIS